MSSDAIPPVPASSLGAEPPPTDPVVLYEFGPFRLDVTRRQLLKDGSVVPLTAKVFDTLLVLVRHHERPVMKEELIQAVWSGTFVSDDSLVQNISALRRALGDDSSQPKYIATLARRGYRFVAPTTEHTASGVTTAPPPTDAAAHHDAHRSPHPPTSMRYRFAAVAGVAALVALILLVAARARDGEPPAQSFRFQEPVPAGLLLRGNAIPSPDGRQIAFAAQDSAGATHLWIRSIDAPEPARVPGTEGGLAPFWSPDGRSLGFAAPGEIKRVGLDSGSVHVVATTHRTRPLGATWGPNNVILYADLGRIFSIPSAGGKPKTVVHASFSTKRGELRWPQWLQDGRHFVFYAAGNAVEEGGTYLAAIDGGEPRLLLTGARAVYAPPDHLLYVRDRTLMAQRFDADRAELAGSPTAIPGTLSPTADIVVSPSGVLTINQSEGKERLVWTDRQGRALTTVSLPRRFSDIALSPDEKQVLAAGLEGGTWELWLIDLERKVSTRVAANGTYGAWSPDGTRFAYSLVGGQGADLHVKPVNGSEGDDAAWLRTEELKAVNGWSPDGRYIVFTKYNTRDATSHDLWLLATSEDRKATPWLETRATERQAVVSPDGRAIAYTSDETGAPEIYLQSFPSPGRKVRISTGGGTQPTWRGDSRELYYFSADRRLMAVGIAQDLTPRPPEPLFTLSDLGASRQYAPSADGRRFLLLDWDGSQQAQRHVTVLTNWQAAQKP